GSRLGLAVPFDNPIAMIRRQWPEALNETRGPADFDLVHLPSIAQADQQPRIGGREIAAASFAMADQLPVADLKSHLRTHRVAIALGPLQLQAQPMIGCR